jgi:hypothetical protein
MARLNHRAYSNSGAADLPPLLARWEMSPESMRAWALISALPSAVCWLPAHDAALAGQRFFPQQPFVSLDIRSSQLGTKFRERLLGEVMPFRKKGRSELCIRCNT